ncbi:hypothetical protein [Nocardia anaemiae]|uniref:hypothetical protein n=1 Tax=Nocardia anaemiae TaxID=263910 RepID=UPI0007A5254A|nr:hypothetical protein [Nocardia anaemiae]
MERVLRIAEVVVTLLSWVGTVMYLAMTFLILPWQKVGNCAGICERMSTPAWIALAVAGIGILAALVAMNVLALIRGWKLLWAWPLLGLMLLAVVLDVAGPIVA